MTILEEELSAALREVTDASQAMVEALEQHEEPDYKISDRYDDAIERARMVLARASRVG
jgi:hypothetical protein